MHPESMLLLVQGAIAVIVAVRWIADRTGLPAAALDASLIAIRRKLRTAISLSVILVRA